MFDKFFKKTYCKICSKFICPVCGGCGCNKKTCLYCKILRKIEKP